jgi:prophage antirepressor-like protein
MTQHANESMLNAVALGDEEGTADEFTDWVTKVVLPSNRKTGSYTLPNFKGEMSPLEFIATPKGDYPCK